MDGVITKHSNYYNSDVHSADKRQARSNIGLTRKRVSQIAHQAETSHISAASADRIAAFYDCRDRFEQE